MFDLRMYWIEKKYITCSQLKLSSNLGGVVAPNPLHVLRNPSVTTELMMSDKNPMPNITRRSTTRRKDLLQKEKKYNYIRGGNKY